MRILIIDEESAIRDSVKFCLESQYFVIDVADNGKEGLQLASVNEYDAIILEDDIPGINGFDVCGSLRKKGNHVPILVLSYSKEVHIRVSFLNHGADDFLTKPFATNELIARLKALLRRPEALHREIYTIDNLELDVQRCQVIRGGKKIYLTRKEFALLLYLLKHQGFVLSRAKLMEHVWDRYIDPFSNTIETHILNLRKKIEKMGQHKLIHTVPGRGYKIDVHP